MKQNYIDKICDKILKTVKYQWYLNYGYKMTMHSRVSR